MSIATENRPWGSFEILLETEYTKVKRITVLAGHKLSLQYHNHRSELWNIVKGCGKISIDGVNMYATPSNSFYIEQGESHRIENTGEEELVFIEVQTGDYFGEDDIVRLEDDYSRTTLDEIRKNQGHPHE